MLRCKNTKLEIIDEVIEDISTTGEGFKDMLSNNKEKLQNVNTEDI